MVAKTIQTNTGLMSTEMPCQADASSAYSTGSQSPAAPADTLYLTETGNASSIAVTDINQGEVGDCWVLAPMAEMALFHPSAITSMIQSNANGSYTVNLYTGANGQLPGEGPTGGLVLDPQTVTTADISPIGVNSETSKTTVGNLTEIWPQIIEAAIAQLNGGFDVITQGGDPADSMEELTGQSSMSKDPSQVTAASLSSELAAGDLVTFDTGDSSDPAGLVTSHAYALEGVQTVGGVTSADFYNPWGVQQPTPIPVSQLAQDFVEVDVGQPPLKALPPAPVLAQQAPDQRLAVGETFSFSLPTGSYTDPAGGSITYAASGPNGAQLPPWLLFNASTDTFSGEALNSSVQTVVVTATTSEGASSAEAFHIYETVANPAFEIQQGDVRTTANAPVSFTLPSGSFTAPAGQYMYYTASGAGGAALPSWLTFNPGTGAFTGTAPAGNDTQTVVVSANTAYGGSAAEAFHIYTTAQAPVLQTQEGDQRVTAGSGISFDLPAASFEDPNGGTVAYSATTPAGSPLPSWLAFDARTDQFSGTVPTGNSTTPVMVTATSSEGTVAAEAFNIYAQAAMPVLIAQAPDQRLGPDQAFSFSLPSPSYSDPSHGSVSLTAQSADMTALPSWMNFNPLTDVFSGTTPAGSGSAAIRIDATTSSGGAAAEAFHVYFGAHG